MTGQEERVPARQIVPEEWFSEKSALERRLGLTEAFSILIGRIIGIARAMGRTPYSHREARKILGLS